MSIDLITVVGDESPVATPTAIPTPPPIPMATPTYTSPVFVPGLWHEFCPGSASGGGISFGKGNAKSFVGLTTDSMGHLVIAWPRLMPNGETYVFVRKWNGTEWIDLGCDLEQDRPIVDSPRGVNRLTVDPADNQLVITMDFYRNFMMKLNGETWSEWAGGGIDDEGLEFFTDIAFLPDHTPVAFYNSGVGSHYLDFRVKKFDGNNWQEFSPGSATGHGISDFYSKGGRHPQIAISGENEIYAVWLHSPEDTDQFLYAKKWDGASWSELEPGSASGTGLSKGDCNIAPRYLTLDGNKRPIVVYSATVSSVSGKRQSYIYVKRFNGTNWEEMGSGSASGYGLCEPGRQGVYPLIVNTPNDQPVAIWQDKDTFSLYAKQWNGIAWAPVGEGMADGLGIGVGEYYDAVVLSDGTIVLAYSNLETRDIYIQQFKKGLYPVPTPTATPGSSGGWMMVDGFGGIHTSSAELPRPNLPYFVHYNIVRDIEPDPLRRGWYMLDGFGGIHRSSNVLPIPKGLPYFGFDIARNLEIQSKGRELTFYLLDGLGAIHRSDGTFQIVDQPWFGMDRAVDLEPDPNQPDWWVLDRRGMLYSLGSRNVRYPLHTIWGEEGLLRAIVLQPDWRSVLIDAYGGRHTDPYRPALDVVNGISNDLYFPGWEIMWDLEWISPHAYSSTQ